MAEQALSVEKMKELLGRVERAEGPDREIDRAIGFALDNWRIGKVTGYDEEVLITGDGNVFVDHPGGMYPSFTESLDEALELVEKMLPDWLPGMVKKNGALGVWECYVRNGQLPTRGIAQERNPDFRWFTGYGPTAPLGLLSALLQALAATHSEGGG